MNRRMTAKGLGAYLIASSVFAVTLFISIAPQVRAAVLSPGDISTCGELAAPGTYSLTTSVSTTTGAACFAITSNSVVLTSSTTGSYTVTGNIVGDGTGSSGSPGYNFTIQNIAVIGTTTANGAVNSSNLSGGGAGGSISVSSSTVSAISSNGGASTYMLGQFLLGSGGSGGTITVTGTTTDMSGESIQATGGSGNGNGGNGTLTVNYSTFSHTGLILSALSNVTLNGPGNSPGSLGAFGGGILGALPGGTVSTQPDCNLGFAGTYTLGTNITGNCRITINGVTVNGAGFSVTGNVIGDGYAAGSAGNNLTLNDITVTGITSSNGTSGGSIAASNATTSLQANGSNGNGGSITVTGTTTNLSNQTIQANGLNGNGGSITLSGTTTLNLSGAVISETGSTTGVLTLDYGSLNHTNLSASPLSDVRLNGSGNLPGDLGAFGGGILGALPGGSISTPSDCNLGFAGSYTLGGSLSGNCRITINGVTLNGGGNTVTGNVVGDGYAAGSAGANFTLNDLTVTGTTSSNGAASTGTGGNGGTISLVASTTVLSALRVSVSGGIGSTTNGTKGSLTLYYTTLDYTNANLPAFSFLTLTGPGGPGNTGPFNGGGFSSPGAVITSTSTCHIIQAGTYTLGADLLGDCYVKADNVVLNGAGHTITGTVWGDGYSGRGFDYTLENATVTGAVTSTGIDSLFGGVNGNGGSLTIVDSTTTGANIYLTGAGYGGTVNIMSSSTEDLSGTIVNVSSSGASSVGGSVTVTADDIYIGPAGGAFSTDGNTYGTTTLAYTTFNISSGFAFLTPTHLVLDGPGGIPGNMGLIAAGGLGAVPGSTLNNISQCILVLPGTYTLGSDLTGNCTISGNGVVIVGAGHAIHGGVYGNGNGHGISGYDFALENITVTGTTSSDGGTLASGGSITVSSSTVATTTADSGASDSNGIGTGSSGGTITISSSTASLVEADGGGNSPIGYQPARETLNLLVGGLPTSNGGAGGTITISTSTTDSVKADGGFAIFGTGGAGGTITITNSVGISPGSAVSADGGNALYCGFGGSGGSAVLSGSTYGTTTVSKGTDATATYSNGGYCADAISSSGSISSISSSGSGGTSQIIGQYVSPAVQIATPSAAVNIPAPQIALNLANQTAFGSPSSGNVASPGTLGQTPSPSATEGGFTSFTRALGTAIGATVQEAAKTAATVVDTPTSKTVQAAGFLAGLVAAAALYANAGLAATSTAASGALLIPLKLWGLVLVGLGIKKRTRPWGTVYDSVTKQPIDPAYVTARDASGKVVAESITDLDGRYGFLLPSGTYYLSARKTHYEFPSKKMAGKQADELYSDLYFGEPVTVGPGEVLDKNIPMDRKDFDWNQQAKKERNLMSFHSRNEKVWSVASNYIYGIGLVVSVIAVAVKPSFYNVAILVAYLLVLVFLRFTIKNKKLGRVIYADTGKPLSFAIFRVTTPDHMAILRSGVCDGDGKYYCIVPKGEYVLDFEEKNPDGSYSPIYESPMISSSSGIINRDFTV